MSWFNASYKDKTAGKVCLNFGDLSIHLWVEPDLRRWGYKATPAEPVVPYDLYDFGLGPFLLLCWSK